MNVTYDKKADAAYIALSERKIARSDEVRPGIVIDFDDDGGVVGIEVLSVSKRESGSRKAGAEVLGKQVDAVKKRSTKTGKSVPGMKAWKGAKPGMLVEKKRVASSK